MSGIVEIIRPSVQTVEVIAPAKTVSVAAPGPQGAPGSGSTFTYTQSIAASIWTVAHNLNRKPQVTVVDSFDEVVSTDVSYVDLNIVRITHSVPRIGAVYIS